MKAGMAKKALVIGTETLSRVVDQHDRDSMIFADGAGAACFELQAELNGAGILGTAAVSYTKEEAYYLKSLPSVNPAGDHQRAPHSHEGPQDLRVCPQARARRHEGCP